MHYFPPYVKGDLEGSGVFLTSGFQPPFDGLSLAKQIDVSSKTQLFATGGSIQHIFLNEKTEGTVLSRFIKNLFSKKTIIYMTITPTLTICLSLLWFRRYNCILKSDWLLQTYCKKSNKSRKG